MFGNMGQLLDLMKNAGSLKQSVRDASEALGKVQVEGAAGGGAVTAAVNGRMEVLTVRIDPKLVAEGDLELLEDLVVAAVNQGLTKARDEAGKALSKIAGGLPLPGLEDLLGPGGKGG